MVVEAQKRTAEIQPRTRGELRWLRRQGRHTEHYEPDPDLSERLGKCAVIAVCGGSGTGKNHHLNLLFENAQSLGVPHIKRVRPFTTRLYRKPELAESKDPYEDHPNIAREPAIRRIRSTLRLGEITVRATLHRSIKKRTLAQVISRRGNYEIYGSRGELYEPEKMSVTEYEGSEWIRLAEAKTFKKLTMICIVPDDEKDWYAYLAGREEKIPDDYLKRLEEFEKSLSICLQNEDLGVSFVLNDYSDTGEHQTFMEMARVIKGEYSVERHEYAKGRAKYMLGHVRGLIEKEHQRLAGLQTATV